jgi:hypothetical protein
MQDAPLARKHEIRSTMSERNSKTKEEITETRTPRLNKGPPFVLFLFFCGSI